MEDKTTARKMTPGRLAERGLLAWGAGLVIAAVFNWSGLDDLTNLLLVPPILFIAFSIGAGLVLMAMLAKSIEIGVRSARD